MYKNNKQEYTYDSPVLRTMLNRLKKYGINLAGSIFNADSGYDGENNYKSIFMMKMFPNIRQRINARNKGRNRKYRKKASEIFNLSLYHYRGLIEGIFGAEETAHHHHQLYLLVLWLPWVVSYMVTIPG